MKGRWAHRIMWKLTLLSIFIFQFSILKAVETIVVGEVVNEAEVLTPDRFWPYPTYSQLLFSE